jgi:hypothetical protein
MVASRYLRQMASEERQLVLELERCKSTFSAEERGMRNEVTQLPPSTAESRAGERSRR